MPETTETVRFSDYMMSEIRKKDIIIAIRLWKLIKKM